MHVGGAARGTWRDFEADRSGGTLALVEHLAQTDHPGALRWLVDNRLIPPSSGAPAPPPCRRDPDGTQYHLAARGRLTGRLTTDRPYSTDGRQGSSTRSADLVAAGVPQGPLGALSGARSATHVPHVTYHSSVDVRPEAIHAVTQPHPGLSSPPASAVSAMRPAAASRRAPTGLPAPSSR